MKKPINVLIVEDSEDDAALLLHTLQSDGYDPVYEVVYTLEAMSEALDRQEWDLVISDYAMPRFSGLDAMNLLQEKDPDLSFILVTGQVGEEVAVDAMKIGANDYILKSNLARLIPAVERELRDTRARRKNRKNEQALRESRERYRLIVETANEGIWKINEEDRTVFVNQNMAEMLGYAVDEIMGQTPYAFMHEEWGKVAAANIQRIRQGSREQLEHRYRRKDGTDLWVIVSSSPVFHGGRYAGVFGMHTDITERKKSEEMLRESHAKLEKTFEQTVESLSAIAEMKDPYTAGHQVRVAKLARAIASELGMSDEQVEAIRTASLLHDIGKIIVPPEILNKPGKLSALERSFVEVHAQASYEILKSIEFEFPIAEIILQHHERLDGTGYPRGLSGDSILKEARILTVADVVEAMASHRPYRPALPLETALEEIVSHRGTLYDAEAVDACLRLFADKGFTQSVWQ
jgi:PAS domain S-box-containing protein/putative nucleotidyltransferase with HDIG domain